QRSVARLTTPPITTTDSITASNFRSLHPPLMRWPSEEAPPVPIPNTAVKLLCTDGTATSGRVGRCLISFFKQTQASRFNSGSLLSFIYKYSQTLLFFIETPILIPSISV